MRSRVGGLGLDGDMPFDGRVYNPLPAPAACLVATKRAYG